MRKIILTFFGIGMCLSLTAQTFLGTGGVIHDYNGFVSPAYYPCVVSGLPATIDSAFGLERICLNISHTYDGDIEIKLMSPDSAEVMLSNRRGGSGHNYINTCFRGQGSNGMIANGSAPFTGEFDPDGNLASFMNGRNPNGTWYLIVTDLAAADSGSVNSFALVFSNNPSPHSVMPCSTTDVTSCLCPDGSQVCDLLPDMTASAVTLLGGSYEVPETLFVDNATPNIGWGPLEIHGVNSCFCDTVAVPCTTTACPGTGLPPKQLVEQTIYHKDHGNVTSWNRPAGTMTYHPSHGHTHVDNWASYTLRRQVYGLTPPDWPIVGVGSKQSFCLVNLGQCSTAGGECRDTLGNAIGPAQIPNFGMGSVTGCAIDQGIFVGNFDIYSSGLDGQWIVLDSLCNGSYFLVSITDPNNVMLETNDNNNWAAVPYNLVSQLNLPFPSVNYSYSGTANTLNFLNSSVDYDSLQWDFGDGITDTAVNPVHTYASTGTYVVVLTAWNHCGIQQRVDTINLTLVGIYEGAGEDVYNFKLYPNPASTQVQADFNLAKRSPVLLQLFDSYGKLLKTLADETMNAGSYHFVINAADLSLAKGVYTVRMTSGASSLVRRIVFVK